MCRSKSSKASFGYATRKKNIRLDALIIIRILESPLMKRVLTLMASHVHVRGMMNTDD